VSAVSTAKVESMLENNVLHFNEGFTLTHSERRDNAKKEQYSFHEAACTLSHLKAIWQAYNAGHEVVLIIEDDAMLTSAFLRIGRIMQNRHLTIGRYFSGRRAT
jgi:GR25 family glycosyltransferase involved in LPS biosynthesis